MRFFDIGANLSHSAFSQDLPQTIERARQAGVTRIVVTGTTVDESMAAIRIAEEFDSTRPPACIRIMPATAARRRSRRCAASPATRASSRSANAASTSTATTPAPGPGKVVRRAARARLVLEQASLSALARRAPAVLRDPEAPPVKHAVAHCFTGERDELRAYLELDLYVGITGWICDERRGRHLLDLVREIPSERLVLETDAPYLTPRDLRPQPRRAATSPPSCRTSRAPWRARSAVPSRSSPPTPRATPAASSACMNLISFSCAAPAGCLSDPRSRSAPRRCARIVTMAPALSRLHRIQEKLG
jgi:TatD DNase family protein